MHTIWVVSELSSGIWVHDPGCGYLAAIQPPHRLVTELKAKDDLLSQGFTLQVCPCVEIANHSEQKAEQKEQFRKALEDGIRRKVGEKMMSKIKVDVI